MIQAFLLLLFSLLLPLSAGSAGDTREPDETLADALRAVSGPRLLADVTTLSGADFNGRQTGTVDDLRSGRFVADRLQSLGLQPAGTEPLGGGAEGAAWAMSDQIETTRILPPAALDISGSVSLAASLGQDFLPVLDSPRANVTAPVVFVGYGIADPSHGVDDYAGLDVRDRVVLFLRGKPDGYAQPLTQADKERAARERGALAFLTATGPAVPAYEARRGIGARPMAFYGSQSAREGPRLPGAWISTDLAQAIVGTGGPSLRERQEALNRGEGPRSAPTSATGRLAWETQQETGRMINVLGLLAGQDPGKGLVLIGAHRDHFGRQAGLLFPGADDNASGTAALLEVARVLKQAGPPRRAILFVSFSGEERGLLGSRLYVGRPAVSLAGTKAMLNIDHAGIGNGRVTVGLTGLSKETATEAGRVAGLADRLDLYGFFPGGDHVPFKEAGIPTATIVSAGPHPHFHQPTDQAETVKADILETAARYLLALAWQLANAP